MDIPKWNEEDDRCGDQKWVGPRVVRVVKWKSEECRGGMSGWAE